MGSDTPSPDEGGGGDQGAQPNTVRRSASTMDYERRWYGRTFDVHDFDEMDRRFGMTNGRHIARFLSRFWLYDPRQGGRSGGGFGGAGPPATEGEEAEASGEGDTLLSSEKEEQPSLDAAWAYFEHVTLPRRFVTAEGKRIERALDSIKAMPGESSRPTRLYNPFTTRNSELGDFGIAVGIYFSTLRALVVIFLIAAAIHIPNFLYFSSTKYTLNGQADVATILKGSAICTDTRWVPCPDCARNPANDALEELWTTGRVVEADGVYFALKNTCGEGDYLYQRGLISWIGMVFMLIALLGLGKYQRRLEVEFDERNATCTDFSVTVANPPGDATDPDEWKRFLESLVDVYLSKQSKESEEAGGKPVEVHARDRHVTCLTVALNNHVLLDALTQRRALKKKIRALMNDVSESHFDEVYAQASSGDADVSMNPKVQSAFKLLVGLDERIRDQSAKQHKAKRIFATFETEVGQRAALSALSVGRLHVNRNNTSALPDERYAFRGKHVLRTIEPTEPLTVRWHDLGISTKIKRRKRVMTTCISILVILAAFFFVRWIWHTYGAEHTALVIAVLNMLMPHVCRYITHLEVHSSEGKKQRSLNSKTLAFRWINTAIVIHLVTPFAWSIARGEHLIKAVCAIFIAEMWTAPLFQLANIVGNIKRHIIAPRKRDQESMNMCFNGGRCELAERYTNMMKILFLCFFFSALFPGAFVLSAVSLLVHYEVDKFCLTRVWAPLPMLGSQVAEFNRSAVIPILLVILAVMNAYIWSGFPYDNICESPDSVPDSYFGTHSLLHHNSKVAVGGDDVAYQPCSQDFLGDYVFPALPAFQRVKWMKQGQRNIVNLHAWTSVAVIVVVLLYTFFKSEISLKIAAYFVPTYKPSGKIYGVDFSDVPGEIFPAYVPQVKSKEFAHPLVACDVAEIPRRFIGWRDPRDEDTDYAEHNLIFEVPESARNKDNLIFSVVRHWPPPPKGTEEKALV